MIMQEQQKQSLPLGTFYVRGTTPCLVLTSFALLCEREDIFTYPWQRRHREAKKLGHGHKVSGRASKARSSP